MTLYELLGEPRWDAWTRLRIALCARSRREPDERDPFLLVSGSRDGWPAALALASAWVEGRAAQARIAAREDAPAAFEALACFAEGFEADGLRRAARRAPSPAGGGRTRASRDPTSTTSVAFASATPSAGASSRRS